MLQIGSLIDNKYKILSEVGHGGMSVVYLAINERANKTWAVKEVRKDGVCDFEAVELVPQYLFPKDKIKEHRQAMESRVKKLARQAPINS